MVDFLLTNGEVSMDIGGYTVIWEKYIMNGGRNTLDGCEDFVNRGENTVIWSQHMVHRNRKTVNRSELGITAIGLDEKKNQ